LTNIGEFKAPVKEIGELLELAWECKKSLFLFGRTGIGKSESVRRFAEQKAEELGLEFVDWTRVPIEKQEEIADTKDKYFIFVDIRLQGMLPEDLLGTINIKSKYTTYKPHAWAKALSNNPGILFLDEFNLASRAVQNAAYQVVLDKVVGVVPLHKDVLVVAAGNVAEDEADTLELTKPLKTRFLKVTVTPPTLEEFVEYVMTKNKGQVNRTILAYLEKNPGDLFIDDETTIMVPRLWEWVLVNGDTDEKALKLVGLASHSEALKVKVEGFIRVMDKIPPIEELLEDKWPESEELRLMCAIMLADSINKEKGNKKIEKAKKILKKTFKMQNITDSIKLVIARYIRLNLNADPELGDTAWIKVLSDKDIALALAQRGHKIA